MWVNVQAATKTSSDTLVSGRQRLKGLVITSGAGAGSLVFKDGGSGGTTLLTINTPAGVGLMDVLIPGAGILFTTDIYVAITAVTSVTAFYG